MRKLLAPLLVLVICFALAGCYRLVTHETDGTAYNERPTNLATFVEVAEHANGAPDAYRGQYVARIDPTTPSASNEYAYGRLQLDAQDGHYGRYAAAFFFPVGTFSGPTPTQNGTVDILRWDGKRSDATDYDFSGIRLTPDHKAALVRGHTGSGPSTTTIGSKFRLREGCWNTVEVLQDAGQQEDPDTPALNRVLVNGEKLVDTTDTNMRDGGFADDVKVGLAETQSDQSGDLLFYVDDAFVSSGQSYEGQEGQEAGVNCAETDPAYPGTKGAFYYPGYGESWQQEGIDPWTRYHPTRCVSEVGCSMNYDYSTANPNRATLVRGQIDELEYGKIQFGISSWLGPGHNTDTKFRLLLDEARPKEFRWSLYYECEGKGPSLCPNGPDPTQGQVEGDLRYIRDRYTYDQAYLRLDGKPVLFVHHSAGSESCATTVNRWRNANNSLQPEDRFFLVLNVFPGWEACQADVDGWHQYGPATERHQHNPPSSPNPLYADVISPGLYRYQTLAEKSNGNQAPPFLQRDLQRWRSTVQSWEASSYRIKLVSTYNDWGEGTSIENADEWYTATGGAYVDVLHDSSVAVPDPTVLFAGDIAERDGCPANNSGSGDCFQGPTSDLLFSNPRPIAVLLGGDNQYETGALTDYLDPHQFEGTWGRLSGLIKPVQGNHEESTAEGYFDYFVGSDHPSGATNRDRSPVGDRGSGLGYHSFNIGDWHFIGLNSHVTSSAQQTWLQNDFSSNTKPCVLAYWHHPRFSGGAYTSPTAYTSKTQGFWDVLWSNGSNAADVVLNGHDHNYQRFKQLDPNHNPTSAGIRQFVAGTGGRSRYGITSDPTGDREQANSSTFGVLKLTLHGASSPQGASYEWQFIPAAGGGSYTDSGGPVPCH